MNSILLTAFILFTVVAAFSALYQLLTSTF